MQYLISSPSSSIIVRTFGSITSKGSHSVINKINDPEKCDACQNYDNILNKERA